MVREAEVQAQLRRIFESPAFATSARSRQFLEFCVDRAIRGQSSQLKETTIAIEIFLRSADYDPKADPIVRVHARRVRDKLDQYYRSFGADDPITINIPKGGYVPEIVRALPRRKTDFSDWTPQAESGSKELLTDASLPNYGGPTPAFLHSMQWMKKSAAAMLAVVLVAAALAALWMVRLSKASARQSSMELGPFTPVDLGTDRASDFAWSPDGRQLAFTRTSKSNETRIYLQTFPAHSQPKPLTEADRADQAHPVWSPDGSEVAFTRAVDSAHVDLVRYNIASERERPIARLLSPLSVPPDFPTLDWSPDGTSILTAERSGPASPLRLVLISLTAASGRPSPRLPPVQPGTLRRSFLPMDSSSPSTVGGWVTYTLFRAEESSLSPRSG